MLRRAPIPQRLDANFTIPGYAILADRFPEDTLPALRRVGSGGGMPG
jgi:hypothetical protein